MKSAVKPFFALALAAMMLFALTACFGGDARNAGGNPSSTPGGAVRTPTPTLSPNVAAITYTIDATAAVSSGKLGEDVLKDIVNNGVLVNKAGVTLPKDSKLTSTFSVFKVAGTTIELGENNAVTIQGIKNGDCGENSRWVLKINGAEITEAFDSVMLKNGDDVVWLYTID